MSTDNSQHHHDLATLAAGGYTGWWDHTGQPAPWPEDFFDTDSEWRPDIQLVTQNPTSTPSDQTRTRRSAVTPPQGT